MTTRLPSPPFVEIPGIANFRTLTGKNVAPGLVYRSADPSRATQEGLQKMSQDLGIRVIFDLRSKPEILRNGPEWAGTSPDEATTELFQSHGMQREWVPVFAAQDYGPEQVALRYRMYTHQGGPEGFVQAYRDILGSAPAAYTRILRHLAQSSPAPTPCLIHCTAGKDRTGLLAALLFLLVGASPDEIADEYALTELGLAALKPLFTERLLKNPALAGNTAGVANMVGSKRENMLATLDMIEEEFGGARAYMHKSCGLTETEIEQLRKNLVDGIQK